MSEFGGQPKRGWRWWLTVLTFGVPKPMERELTASERREDAAVDRMIEMTERASIPCVMCEDIGEPHVCERAWWQQQLDHAERRPCADTECCLSPVSS